jgi:hypothetical protein
VELVLNILWLLLIGPGIYLWLRRHRQAKPLWQCSVALACLLVLLFPVISATDDLHAVGQEMEEAGTNKSSRQIVKRAVAPDFSVAVASLADVLQVFPPNRVCGCVEVLSVSAPVSAAGTVSVARAPPSFLLSLLA